jgi:hypothetical protein
VAVMDVARSFSVSVKAASGRQWFPMIGRGVEILGVSRWEKRGRGGTEMSQ